MDKASVAEVVEEIASRLNLLLRADDGRKAFGPHVYRVSGARHFAYRGSELRINALLARRQSEIVLHYVQEAPLTMLTGLYLGKTGTAQGQILGSAASGSNECARGNVVDDEVTNMLREVHRQDFQFTMVQVLCAEMAARVAETATAELERLVLMQAAKTQEFAKAQVPHRGREQTWLWCTA